MARRAAPLWCGVFVFGQVVAKALVAQRNWPAERRWIAPSGHGGVAGGVKFQVGQVRDCVVCGL